MNAVISSVSSSSSTVKVGSEILVQFGNPSDNSGYEVVSATVVAIDKRGHYLVRKGDVYGPAVPTDGDFIGGYCTNTASLSEMVRYYGSEEKFFRSVGFSSFTSKSVDDFKVVEETAVVQFGYVGEGGYDVAKSTVLARHANGTLLVKKENYIGTATLVRDREDYPSNVVASCTRACQTQNVERHYHSYTQMFESFGFKGFTL